MGQISRKLAALIQGCRSQIGDPLRGTTRADPFAAPRDIRTVPELLAEGHDPVHAAYVSAQNLVSSLTEQLCELEDLAPYVDLYCDAEEEYMPSGPPMSPLSTSYFTTWASFDLRFGPDQETIGTCLIDVGAQTGMEPGMMQMIRLFQQSRMGIYEYAGIREGRVQLRELVTGDEFNCFVPAGYLGKTGELWYVRLCPPPLVHDRANYHVAFTTPYVLGGCTKADWVAYLKKSIGNEGAGLRQALHDFLKYGPTPNFWNEYVFLSYHHFQRDVVFLAGLPDVKGSLPHGDLAKKRR